MWTITKKQKRRSLKVLFAGLLMVAFYLLNTVDAVAYQGSKALDYFWDNLNSLDTKGSCPGLSFNYDHSCNPGYIYSGSGSIYQCAIVEKSHPIWGPYGEYNQNLANTLKAELLDDFKKALSQGPKTDPNSLPAYFENLVRATTAQTKYYCRNYGENLLEDLKPVFSIALLTHLNTSPAYIQAEGYFYNQLEAFDQEGYGLYSCSYRFFDEGVLGAYRYDKARAESLKDDILKRAFRVTLDKLVRHELNPHALPDYFESSLRNFLTNSDYACSLDPQSLVDDLKPVFSIALLKFLFASVPSDSGVVTQSSKIFSPSISKVLTQKTATEEAPASIPVLAAKPTVVTEANPEEITPVRAGIVRSALSRFVESGEQTDSDDEELIR